MPEEKQIDWSKAPEGATHFTPKFNESGFWCDVFWRIEKGAAIEAWRVRPEGGIDHFASPNGFDASRATPRPAAWDGAGLPQAGTVCEYLDSSGSQWHRVTVLFSGKDLMVLRGEADGEEVEIPKFKYESPQFRPIRTAEQIAAEERLLSVRNACTAIARTLDELRGSTKVERAVLRTIEAMIDAGYSKAKVEA